LAQGRAWLEAIEPDKALALARLAQTLDPAAPGPALLALEMMPTRPAAEELVKLYLQRADAENPMRLAYVRSLVSSQRYADAVAQLEIATRKQPEAPAPFLSLGALQLELKHLPEAEAALQKYVQLVQPEPSAAQRAASAPAVANAAEQPSAALRPEKAETGETGLDANDRLDPGLDQAWLMLAQVAELRADFVTAEDWLTKVQNPARTLEVQTRRAAILAKQGRVAEARELIRETPENRPEDLRAKMVAEAAVMRESKRWQDAYEVLATANTRIPDDADLLYEQAMMAEKLGRPGDMERLLRRVINLKPDNAHAYNALGYSLADRGERLQEARQLIVKALELMPGDPFITDSMGWVEFRLGNREEALRLLRQAYAARPDTEIGAHLGEVLWSLGRQDEARQVWRQSKTRDSGNDVLREALNRLHVEL
jgi:Flp pilus assembly protein TadD